MANSTHPELRAAEHEGVKRFTLHQLTANDLLCLNEALQGREDFLRHHRMSAAGEHMRRCDEQLHQVELLLAATDPQRAGS